MAFDPNTARAAPFDPASASPVQEQQQELPFALDRIKKGVAGALSLTGLPVDAITQVVNLLGADIKDPVGGSGQIRRGYEALFGVKDLKPESKMQGLRGSIYEFAGSGALPAGYAAALAPTLGGKAAVLGVDALQNVMGGTGAFVGEDLAGPTGAMVGGMAGGLYPTTQAAIVSAGIKAGQKGASSIRGMPAKELDEAMRWHPDAAPNIARSEDVARDVEALGGQSFNPRLSQRTDSPGVSSIEERIIRSSPARLERAVGNEANNVAAVDAAAGSIGTQAKADGMRRAAGLQIDSAHKRMEGMLGSLDARIKQVEVSQAGRGQQEVGESLYKLYEMRRDLARKVRDAKYSDVYETANRTGFKTPMDDVVSELTSIRGADENTFQKIPDVYRRAIENWTGTPGKVVLKELPRGRIKTTQGATPPQPATFEEIHSLWKRTNADQAAASRSGDVFQQHFLGELKGALQKKLSSIEAGGAGELTTKFREANRWYGENYARVFREGVGGKMGASGRFEEQIRPEKLTQQFFNPSGADDFYAVFGNDPAARGAMMDGVLDMFTKSGQGAQTFMRKHAETLNKFPEIKQTLQNNDALITAYGERSARLKDRQKLLDQSAVAKLSNEQNPAALISRMVEGLDRRGLVGITAIRDQATRSSVARMVADAIPDAAAKAGKPPLQYLTENEAVFRPVMDMLSPKHFDNLKTITEARTILGRGAPIPARSAVNARMDPLEEKIGTTTQSALNMARTTLVTRAAGPHGMATVLLGKFMNKLRGEHADRVLETAMYDPAIARDLAMASRVKESAELETRINKHLVNLGIKASAQVTDQ